MTFVRSVYDLDRYHHRRAWAVMQLGGQCVDCSSVELLEFDHVDPATKKFDVSAILLHGDDKVLRELAKCVLRCQSCHKKRTTAQQSVGHGEGASGKRNCKCSLCRARKAEYMRSYKLKRKGASS